MTLTGTEVSSGPMTRDADGVQLVRLIDTVGNVVVPTSGLVVGE